MQNEQYNNVYTNPRYAEMDEKTPYIDKSGAIICKHTPTAGIIVLTAIVFLIVGALVMGGVMLCLMATGSIDHIGYAAATELATEQPTPSPTPLPTDVPTLTPAPTETPAVMGLPELIESVIEGVVVIHSYDSNRATEFSLIGTGTGFCVGEGGILLTNAHVVQDAVRVQATLYDGAVVDVAVIGEDNTMDVAVLKIEGSDIELNALELGDSSSVRAGDFVVAIGHPTGDDLKFSATFGMVGAIDRTVNIEGKVNAYIQIDAAINPGNSGGPLFDMTGKVIGVTSAKTVTASFDENGNPISAEGLGFALPINSVLEVSDELISTGTVERPGMGLSIIAISEERAQAYSLPQGLLVYYVIEDAPAHLAGLRANDIIIECNGVAMLTNEELSALIEELAVGDVLTIRYYRNGVYRTCELTLANLNKIGDTVYNNEYGGDIIGME